MTDQMSGYQKVKAFITSFAKTLLYRAEQIGFSQGQLNVAYEGKHFSVSFTREDLDDPEPVH
jgi:hypothetical protein